ncbi:hypothetical protein KGB53_gp57 [Klebsiella virus KpV2811]|jgi:hypothetical protein|uniref:hypothetical protein n=1 Tax=Klebsiella virus KpV2811 TaxID=2759464 RepID=UPI0017523EE5|nr:hypothetical protein KGB53_gp57 [Klebsiella virus KpV2811]QMP82023.1 hypothetical protein KpV2811_057 [Klebsiella virus KpV2811]
MKKLIAAAVFAMASFGASAGEFCNAVGEFGEAAAEARDAGVSKQLALMVSSGGQYSAEFNQLSKAIVDGAYKMTDKTPKEVAAVAREVCLSTMGDK